MSYGGRLRGIAAIRAVLSLPSYWLRLRRALRDADLVWINDLRGLWLAGPAARLARKPTVWQVHAKQPQYRWSARIARVFCQRVVVPSQTAGRDLLPAGTSFDVLPNMIESMPHSDPAGDSSAFVVTVARLQPIKGLDVLLRACAILRDRGVEPRLTIVGGTQPGYEAYADELQRLSKSLGLTGVTFAGETAEPLRIVSSATIYVQPSHHETFGLAALEAMAMGLPVVVCGAGGLADLVEDGVTGVVVPPGDPESLAAALGGLLLDPARRRALGDAARRVAQERYGPEGYATKVLSILGSTSEKS
jgi:glycosyltransferase involved in cell wall biosynthesis